MNKLNGITTTHASYHITIQTIEKSIHVFGRRVESFPDGIGEAFTELSYLFPDGNERSYFGISFCDSNKIFYYVTTEEKFEGESQLFASDKFEIESGEYLAVTLKEWQTKTDSIKEIFHHMMQDDRIDFSKPCVEWYKNDDEMICLIRLKI